MPKNNTAVERAPVRRDTTGLRDALFDELDALRHGKSTHNVANATSRICSTIIESVRMELEVRKFLQSAGPSHTPEMPVLGIPIELGQ